MEILLVVVVSIFNLLSFYLGAKISENKTEEIKLKPMQIYKKYKTRKEKQDSEKVYQKEQQQIKTEFENIDKYDGTPLGQEDIV